MIGVSYPTQKCGCKGKCFARGDATEKCSILTEAYQSKCPFQKANRHYTKGVYFPDNPYQPKGDKSEDNN